MDRTFTAQVIGAIESFIGEFSSSSPNSPGTTRAPGTGVGGGVFPVEIALRGRRGDLVIEVFVDGDSGVDTAACADLSRGLAKALDGGVLRDERYALTVSSPGLDRPLKFPRQYPKHAGRRISVLLRKGDAAERVRGVLVDAGGQSIRIRTGPKDDPREIAYAEIAEAKIETPW